MIRFKYFFKNTIKKELFELTNCLLNEQWQLEINKSNIDSLGILGGRKIIFEFLDFNEIGCAYGHLAYMISELDINFTADQIIQMDKLATKLNIKSVKQ
uniref:hypothetical protein n=1 Tax=Flavobacterium sp. TaxID=239 RepID=UPI004048ED6E